jgi:hypothetical protein
LAKEVEQSQGDIVFVSTDQKPIVETATALEHGGQVPFKVIGALLYYIADMAEE